MTLIDLLFYSTIAGNVEGLSVVTVQPRSFSCLLSPQNLCESAITVLICCQVEKVLLIKSKRK